MSLHGLPENLHTNSTPSLYLRRARVTPLSRRWQLILEYHLLGKPHSQIAEELNISPQTVRNVIRSDLGQRYLAQRYEELDEEFKGLYRKVINTIRECLDSSDERVRLLAAEKWLKAHGKFKEQPEERVKAEVVIQQIFQQGGK